MATARVFLGTGDLYMARYVNGQKGPMLGPFFVEKFEIKTNVEVKEKTSKGNKTYGQVIASVALPKSTELSITFGEVDRSALAMALMGSTSVKNTASGVVTAADPIKVKSLLGAWIPLEKENWAESGLTVKSDDDATTYQQGADYEINYRMGWIRAKVGGAIPANAVVHVSGAYNAISGIVIAGATQTEVKGEFILEGTNFADKLPCIVRVPEGRISADSPFDFLTDEFAQIELKGHAITPAGKEEPFTVELRDTAE